MKQGRVYLVGAGCGRADLITLRGKDRLEHCDAVVYDDLIDPALLDFAPAGAERIYMGKREGRHSASQAEINDTLISLAAQGRVVVRLKGGDPFVFGRGGEEIMALREAGIPFEEVPGISSAIAIPAGAGIPVTHRGLSRSIHIITGHTADTPDGLPTDLPHLAKCGGTLIFLMGLGKLPLIARQLMEYGRSPDTPAAVISGGNAPHPAVVRGTLSTIVQKSVDILPPAVIVVGGVAGLDLSSTLRLPMDGLRVGVIGTRRMTEILSAQLTQLGAAVQTLARLRTAPLPLDPRLLGLADPAEKWLVFTSPAGVSVFFDHLRSLRLDVRSLFSCRFAAIGPATAEALEQRGIFPDLCPEQHTSAGLARALAETLRPGTPIFLLRSTRGAPVLKTLPEQSGFSVTDIPLYDILPDESCPVQNKETLSTLDYLLFSSAGGVAEYFRLYEALPDHAIPVCIGAVTAAALAKHTDRSSLVARDAGAGELIQTILSHMEEKKDFC